jgi:hypothetical protein
VQPLSVVAVVGPGSDGGKQLWFGIWGDMNGDDGAKPMVGEASLAMATLFGGASVNGNSGLDADDYLYLVFRGADAVPGPDGADWVVGNSTAFEGSIDGLGMRLVERVQADAATGFGSYGGWIGAASAAALVAFWFRI